MSAVLQDSDGKVASSGTVTSKAFTAAANDLIVIAAFGAYSNPADLGIGNGTVADGGGTFTTDAVGSHDAPNQQNCGLMIARRLLTAAGSYTFTAHAESTSEVIQFCALVRGAHPSTPIDAYGISATAQGTNLQTNTAPSLTPTTGVTDDLLLAFFGMIHFNGATTWTPPSGMSEVLDLSDSNNFLTAEFASQALASSAATGAKTATSTRTSGETINGQARAMFLIRSAPAVTVRTGAMLIGAP